MSKVTRCSFFFFSLLTFLLVQLSSISFAVDVATVQGRIVSENKHNRHLGKGDFIRYVLRIQQVGDVVGNVPRLFTAEIMVEPGSLEEEIIRVAKKKGNVCQFSISRRGMRYYVHAIYLLRGAGFGQDVSPVSIGNSLIISGKAVYRDKKNKVVINNRESVKKSYVSGNSGISIGGQ